MSLVNDFYEEITSTGEKHQDNKLAKVVGLFDNGTAKVQFDGEDTPSEKQYAYISTYKPVIGDRVGMLKWAGTYILLGKIKYGEPPDDNMSGFMRKEDMECYALKDDLKSYVQSSELDGYAKNSELNDYIRKNSGSSVANYSGELALYSLANKLNELMNALRGNGIIK